jgi:hypothetical protein
MKFIFLVFILSFCSLTVSAQYLETNDIDIFIEGSDIINNVLDAHIDTFGRNTSTSEEWAEYSSLFRRFSQSLLLEPIDLMDEVYYEEKYKEIEGSFSEFINCTIPNELKEAFEIIGWGDNGNQKYWTIIFVYYRLREKFGVDLLFNDTEIKEIIEELKKTEYGLIAINEFLIFSEFGLRTIEIINQSDVDLINNRYDELNIFLH